MSTRTSPSQDAAAAAATSRKFRSAYDDPGTHEEITRRTFMANATLVVGGIIGLGLAVPIVGSLIPRSSSNAGGSWSPLSDDEFRQLQSATETPVKLTFALKSKDSYLPESSIQEYVWGIKIKDANKFKALRPDLFDNPKAEVPYNPVNMNFVIFSPICPHLGCAPNWDKDLNRFKCPCHGSQFGFNGDHLAGPAPRGLDPLPLREQSGKAEITWIRYQQGVPDRIVISYVS